MVPSEPAVWWIRSGLKRFGRTSPGRKSPLAALPSCGRQRVRHIARKGGVLTRTVWGFGWK